MIFSAEQLPEVCRGHPTASFTLVFTVFLCVPDRNIVPKRHRFLFWGKLRNAHVKPVVRFDMTAGRRLSTCFRLRKAVKS
jgi:hypothetical protein